MSAVFLEGKGQVSGFNFRTEILVLHLDFGSEKISPIMEGMEFATFTRTRPHLFKTHYGN